MPLIRGLALFVFQCLVTPLFALTMIVCIPLGGTRVYAIAKAWCGLMVRAASVAGMRHVFETEGVPPAGPAVILAKHSSAWETFFIVHHFPRLVPVVKRELLWVPFFGWGLALCRPIAIDRSLRREARAQLQDQGIQRLADGLWVMIFPEGTRIPAGQRGRYASGGTALAMAAQVPVVALAHDAGFYWRKSLLDKRGGTIRVRLSAPMHPLPGESAAELTLRAEEWIERQIESFGHPLSPAPSRGRLRAGDPAGQPAPVDAAVRQPRDAS